MRLREISDVDRLRRELWKIRTKEMTGDDYIETEPWERDMNSRIPDEVRRDVQRRRFERMEDLDDLKHELWFLRTMKLVIIFLGRTRLSLVSYVSVT